MSIRQSFKMALKSIFSNKVRSALTMLGIMIGVAAVMTLVAVVQGQNKHLRDYYESLGTNIINVEAYKYDGKDMTQKLYDFCLGMDDLVLGVTPNGNAWGDIKYKATSTSASEYGWAQTFMGSDQYSLCNNYKLASGRDLTYLDIKNYNQVAVIGSQLKEYLFPYRDPIGERITISGVSFRVVGVYAQKGNAEDWYYNFMAVIPYSMSRILNTQNYYSSFTVRAKSAAATNDAIRRLEEYLKGEIGQMNGYYYVYSQNQQMEQEEQQNQTMGLVLGGIAGISLLVGGIGIMNIMLVTVRERTREIGIRKAIGGARSSILMQFLIEAGVICGMGGIVGIAIGYLGSLVAGKLMLNLMVLPTIPLTAIAFAFSVVLGIIFGMYPAIKASGLQPVEALRAE